MSFKIFSEKRDVRKVERISNFLDGKFCGTEFCLRISDDKS